MKRIFALLLTLAMMLSLAGTAFAEPITDFVTYQTTANEMETFNILYSQYAKELDVLTNCIDGLLSNDNYGNLIPGLAETWETLDGGLTWTFNLRKGVKWVDYQANEKAEVVAEDFLWGLEWVLNEKKNLAANMSMPSEMIVGAQEYFDYTKELPEADALALGLEKFQEMVGIKAVDDYTLVFTCKAPMPYFATLGSYNCLYPVSGKLLAELGVEGMKAVSYDTLWYNGPYTMTTYVQNNEKVLTKNPTYWNKDIQTFNTVTVKMVDSVDIAFQMYQTGELDNVTLNEANLQTIYRSPSHEFHNHLNEARPTKYSYQIHLVYDKKLEDGSPDVAWNTAIANEAFRLSWYYGMDFTNYLGRINAINPLNCTNYCYTAANLVATSDGKDYVQHVMDLIGLQPSSETYTRFDAEKGAAYKQQAMEELSAKGVTFPIQMDYYVQGSNQSALDTAQVLKQTFIDCLGEDYVVMNIKTFVNSLIKEVRAPQLASFYINGWGADYGDPINYLGQETYGKDNAFYSSAYSKIDLATDEDLIAQYKEFTALVDAAAAINDDLDARYKAFAVAEAYMIEHALVIPLYVNISWQLTGVNDYSKIFAAYGIQNNRYINWETNKQGYTTEDYVNFAKVYEENRK